MSTTTSVSANAIDNMTKIAAHELTKQIQKNLVPLKVILLENFY